jgi:DNA polymerase III subunit gamma/tau
MSLITQRPKTWQGIIGQPRALRVLQSLLKTTRFLLRGFIFEGVKGVGKTTSAYIFARALMCTGTDPLGCGTAGASFHDVPQGNQCPSCALIDAQGIDQHPDFREVDAASYSGVDAARSILESGIALPILGKRRITMIDEAHCLSYEAWCVYLKPLEAADTDTIFIFVTNNSDKIPDTITSRCCRVRFAKVVFDAVLGLLSALCAENHIMYEVEALRVLASAFKGQVRNPVKMLDIVASMGNVTTELVKSQIDTTLEDGSLRLFRLVLEKKQPEAVALGDELTRTFAPAKIIEAMFSVYAKAVFTTDDQALNDIIDQFGDVPKMTAFFTKWHVADRLPSDILPLFLHELFCIRDPRIGIVSKPFAPEKKDLSPKELAGLLGAQLG